MVAWLARFGIKLGSLVTGPWGWVANLFLDYVWKYASKFIKALLKDKKDQAEERKEADDDMAKADALTDHSSKKEQEDAAKDALRHL